MRGPKRSGLKRSFLWDDLASGIWDKVHHAGAVTPDIASEALVGRYIYRCAPAVIWIIAYPLGIN